MFDRLKAAAAALTQSPPPVSPWQPADALTQLTLSEVFGFDGRPVSRSQAMTLGPVKRGRKLVTGQLGSFPLVVYRGHDQLATQPSITMQPEAGRPRAITFAWVADALMFHGRAFLEVLGRDWTGRPSGFSFVPEWKARTDGAGTLLAIDGRKVGPRDWIRIDADDEGLLTSGREDINQALAIKLAVGRAAANPVPSIDLHQTAGEQMTNKEIDSLVSRWASARAGQNGGISYTNQSIEARVLGQNVEQLLIAARNQSAIDLANQMNLPAWAVDASVEGSSLTYSNVPSRTRELIDYTLMPFMNAIAGRLSMDDVLPAGTWCQFDTSAALQGTFAERMTGYKTAIDAAIYTPEECRALERGLPLEERKTS